MEQRKLNGINIIMWLFGLIFLGVCIYFALGEEFLPPEGFDSEYKCEEFGKEWVWVKQDGTRVPIELPAKCDVERNEIVTIETTLPENLESGMYLCFRSSRQEVSIYVDGKLRQQYSTKDTRLFGRTSAAAYVFLKLETEDAGKTVSIETQSDSSYSGILRMVYYGNQMGIWYYFFQQYGIEFIVAFLMFVLGIFTIIGSILLHLSYHKKVELQYLGWGVSIAAIWLITNSVFRELLFPNLSTLNDIPFFMIMLMPIPFMLYMNGIQKGRYYRLYVVGGIIDIADFIVCTLLHLMNRRELAENFGLMAAVCFLTILMMGITIVIDIRKRYIWEYRLPAIGILGACLAASVQMIMYFNKSIAFNGVVMSLGLIFLLLISILNTIREILWMEQEKQQAISSSKAKARFLANMSHEIRTPINAVLGMDAMILRESKDEKIKEYALDIQNAGQSLLSLINDILDLSKVESGKMEIIPAEYDFSSMIHDVVNMISVKLQDKNLKLKVFVDRSLPSRLFGDEIRIRQVLINILNNAVKYTSEGSVSLNVNGTVQADKVLLNFAVTDTGIGIKKEEISKLFAEFERIEEQRNRNIEGTGLGMSITMHLLAMMGSELKVESVYGEGSTFRFELEQQIVDVEPIGNLEERIRQQMQEYTYEVSFIAPDAHVLVVDDNSVNQKVFVNLLKETKINIDTADSGKECLELIEGRHYDIIFLDHMMPDMDGIETLHHIKKGTNHLCKDTPVIVLTANAVLGAEQMYLSEGFDGFLSKPIIPEKLERMVQELLPRDMISLETDKLEEAETVEESGQTCQKDITDLPVVDGIDWNYAWLHLPDMKLLQTTVRDFYRSIDSEADYLEQKYVDNDLDAYRIKVHAMKSSAALIGAIPLSGIAKILEYAARDGKMEVIQSLTAIFLEEWRGYKERLEFCVCESKEKPSMEDSSVFLAYLEMLRIAMEKLDIDNSDQIVEQLMQYQYPPDIQVSMEQLYGAVANLDSEQVTVITENLMKRLL